MSPDTLYKNLLELAEGIESCFEQRLVRPTLILLYSAIDIVSWLASDNLDAQVRDQFTAWVDAYMLPAKPLDCTAIDIYAARCGVVHRMSADSRLFEQGKARRILYAWGTGTTDQLREAIKRLNVQADCVAVHLSDLKDAWRLGLKRFHDTMDADPDLAARVHARAEKFFGDLPIDKVQQFLDLTGTGGVQGNLPEDRLNP